MKRIYLWTLYVFSPWCLFAQLPGLDKNWETTKYFEETFNTSWTWQTCQTVPSGTLSSNGKWMWSGDNGSIIHGNSISYFQPEEACFELPGIIHLKAETVTAPPCNFWNDPLPVYNIKSGLLTSVQQFRYGYFEIRCTLPNGSGFFPSFWFWSGINRYNEIDIFENFGDNLRYINSGYYDANGNRVGNFDYFIPANQSDITLYHTYSMEWFPSHLIFYFDGIMVGLIKDERITDQYMNMMAQLMIRNSAINSDQYQIDYISVYHLKSDYTTPVTASNFDFVNFDYKLKKSFELTNSSVLIGQSVTLRATDYILLNGDFTVPLGAEFTSITHPDPGSY